MLLASWLLGPIDALRAVATLPLPDRRARHLRARAAARREPHGVGLRCDRLRRLGPPRGALGGARAAGRRGLARAGARAGGGRPPARGRRGAASPSPGSRVVLALHLASGSQQLAALTLATCVLWLLARAGTRGLHAPPSSRSRSRSASRPSRSCLASSCCATRPPRGTSTPTGSARCCSETGAGSSGRFGVSHSEIATLYLGAATPALA